MSSYPPDLEKRLRQHVEKTLRRDWQALGLPDREALVAILETAFHTSFLTEEGRALHFQILIATPEVLTGVITKFYPEFSSLVELEAPRRFSISELRRISPATDTDQTLVCVSAGSGYMSSEIWGLLNLGNQWSGLAQKEIPSGAVLPDFVIVSSTSPGQLKLFLGHDYILQLEDGEIREMQNGAFHDGTLDAMLEHASFTFARSALDKLEQMVQWDLPLPPPDTATLQKVYIEFITRIAKSIERLRHGGALFIVPDDSFELNFVVNIKYRIKDHNVWGMLVDSVLRPDATQGQDRIEDCISFISSMSLVDGAIVMTERLQVLGFGAEIIVKNEAMNVVSGGRELVPMDNFGTRHRSAFRFCNAVPGAIGFVISSDGGIRMVFKEDESVVLLDRVDDSYLGW